MTSLEDNLAKVVSFYEPHASTYHQRTYEHGSTDHFYARLRDRYRTLFKGHTVLEIAAGSGYWTELVATSASRVLATDANEKLVEIIRHRLGHLPNLDCMTADAYSLSGIHDRFSAACAQYWWSHMPKQKVGTFLTSLHSKLLPGALVFFCDDLRYEHNHWTRRIDEHGDIQEERSYPDGTRAETIKNFPTHEELIETLSPHAEEINYEELEPEHLWAVTYRLRK
jgi:protein-L-isoaspartate O-methyltransferase